MPSGHFTFTVQARKNGGSWSKAAQLPITVAIPWWRNIGVIAIAAIALLLCFYVIIRGLVQRVETRKRRQLLLINKMNYLKQQALGALINPHFVFNAMNSIQHYLNRADTAKANKYLANFAGLIRVTLEHAQEAFIPLDVEMARLNLYLSLEQLRTGPDLQFSVEIDDRLTAQKCYIPNMVLQPYVENAIWHGIVPKDAPGMLRVSCALSEPDLITVRIVDDGVGYQSGVARTNTSDHKSLGMMLTAERLALFQKLLDKTCRVDVETLLDEAGEPSGTSVIITFPFLTNEDAWRRMEQLYAV
jgi:LytS/YehU family sensor histidine kinase